MNRLFHSLRHHPLFVLFFAFIFFTITLPLQAQPFSHEWEELLGMYGQDQRPRYIIRENNGSLEILIPTSGANAALTWNEQPYIIETLIPVTPDSFRDSSGSFSLTFTRNAAGQGNAFQLSGNSYPRQFFGPESGMNFRIIPTRSLENLRAEALQATPPKESGSYLPSRLVDVAALDPAIRLDIRYASSDNFMGMPLYPSAKAFLQDPAALALVQVSQALHNYGYGLVIHDAYRPWYVTWMFWSATPESQRMFVANPASGSRHNRGCAVDVSLYDLSTGMLSSMGSGYDEFSLRAYASFPGGTSEERNRRQLLADCMTKAGFQGMDEEWWHFDYQDWNRYPISNLDFSDIQ